MSFINAGKIANTVPGATPNLSTINQGYFVRPDITNVNNLVSFGTSGHRGRGDSFTESHIEAIVQATVDYRIDNDIKGPLFVGIDSHALSEPAMKTTLKVLSANHTEVLFEEALHFDGKSGFTPTPAISFAILEYNKKHSGADGLILTPSHNPPTDGGIKYNPTNGGPANSKTTKWIENRANEYLKNGNEGVKVEASLEKALKNPLLKRYDFVTPYVKALADIIDMDAIKKSGINIGVDPLGGASLEYYQKIKEMYGLNMTIVNPNIDMTFGFMNLDWDGKIRMDCSSPNAMKSLIALKDKYDIAWGNDTDSDRHGIVVPSMGLMNPNHFLSVAVWYLLNNRPNWPTNAMFGKTVVTTSLINRILADAGKDVYETPVGFKYFADGLYDKSVSFGCEESAGASFLRKDASVWTTDKDGIILGLLAAEILAKTKKDPGIIFKELTKQHGMPFYGRIGSAANRETKAKLLDLKASDIKAKTLAGDDIISIMIEAPYGGAIGGLKIVTKNGWAAIRPSGTEDVAKVYAESFISEEHLKLIQEEATQIMIDATKQ